MKKHILSLALVAAAFAANAQTHISFADTEEWTAAQLQKYVGQTVIFDQPVYICNNYYSSPTASMHRIMSPTNQERPGTNAYNDLVTINSNADFSISNYPSSGTTPRMGEKIYGLKAQITSTGAIKYISSDSIVGTRADLLKGIPNIDILGEHDLLVCTMNLEYYLTEQFGSGSSSSMGPADQAAHDKQRAKTSAALAFINADIYGLVEVQQGQGAMAEIAADLTRLTGRNFTYINDGSSASGTYTKSGYVYCTDVVETYGDMKSNNTAVSYRKKMQGFKVKTTGEMFIFSLNHFKAKSGSANAVGDNADKGDGQGAYNATRVQEATSVLSHYETNKNYYKDDDLLVMGDLNAYGKEDPIITLTDGGLTDLHRYFHADSSYSYTFRGQAGYLDHALCNSTLLPQITGMAAFHINSDENDNYTYNGKTADATMFRASDHDPVLVGLKLGASFKPNVIEDSSAENLKVSMHGGKIQIQYAADGYYTIHDVYGHIIEMQSIHKDEVLCQTDTELQPGLYIVTVYVENTVKTVKIMIP